MSNAVSALGGVSDVTGVAEIQEVGPQGMITMRGDLTDAAVKKAIKVTGCAVPKTRAIATKGDMSVAWMSPDEVLIMCPYGDVASVITKLQKALGTAHALVVDVSDARAVFHVSGPATREVIAKLAPVDMSPDAFGVGAFRRTRMAQVAAAFHMKDAQTCEIICFRSVGQYMFDLLKVVAAPGSEVGFFS